MAFTVMYDVMQWVDTNGDPASGFVLKAYDPGTTTPVSIFIDKDGASPQATITFNAEGKPEVSGNEIVPFIDRDYKWAIFSNATDAAANTNPFAGFYDNIPQSLRADDAAATFIDVLTTAAMTALAGLTAGVHVVQTAEFSTDDSGGGTYDIISGTGNANDENILAHDSDNISFVLREKNILTFEEFGSVGSVDEASLIANVFSRAQGKIIKGKNGRIYVSSTEQQKLPSTELDLGGARLRFDITGSTKGLIESIGGETHNGTIEINGTSPTGSGETQTPINAGDFQNGSGVENFKIHDLTLISNKADGNLCNLFGGTNNGEVYNIITPSSATVSAVVQAHWGGQASTNTIEHPHNIKISNIRSDGMTGAAVPGALVFLSGVYNMDVKNVKGTNVIRGVVVSSGDFGDDYSVSAQKGKIGKNITLDEVLIEDCFKTGLQIDGYTAFGLTQETVDVTCDTTISNRTLTNVNDTSKLFVGRVIDLGGGLGQFQIRGISGASVTVDRNVTLTTVGTVITGGAWELHVTANNCSFECDGSSTVVAPLVMGASERCHFKKTAFQGGFTNGVKFVDWAFNNTWEECDISENQQTGVLENRKGKANGNKWIKCKFRRNNLALGTNRTTSVSVFLSSQDGQVIDSDFGDEANETAFYHISIDSDTPTFDNDLIGNRFHGISSVGGSAAFKNGHGSSTQFFLRTLAVGNVVKSGVNYQDTNSTPMLSARITNQDEQLDNVEFKDTVMPATGSWVKGDKVFNSNPTVDGNNMVLAYWDRLITGSNNVLNTDWVAQYISTVTPAN